jgi:hypothetical protein
VEITFVAVHPDEPIGHDDQVLNKPMLLCPITKRCIVVVEVLVGLLEPYASTSLVFEDDLLTQEDWYHGGQLKIGPSYLDIWTCSILQSRLTEKSLFSQGDEVHGQFFPIRTRRLSQYVLEFFIS